MGTKEIGKVEVRMPMTLNMNGYTCPIERELGRCIYHECPVILWAYFDPYKEDNGKVHKEHVLPQVPSFCPNCGTNMKTGQRRKE